ncbi:MAG: hypothetical protein ACYTDT_09570 [Planctomycetota bacterium]|jgi:hypothetical protein
MNKATLESIHGQKLALLAMRVVWGFEDEPPKPTKMHGGLPINGHWAFRTMTHAREVYKRESAGKGLPAFKSGTLGYSSQAIYFVDDTSVLTLCDDAYEAYLHQAIVLVCLVRGEWE